MEASVARVLDRESRSYTGTIRRQGKSIFVVPDDALLSERLPLRTGRMRVASGEKALFHLDSRGLGKPPRAVLDEIVGEGDDAWLDHLVVAMQFRLDLHFPAAVEEEAEGAVGREDNRRREDLRSLFTLTIDPTDAKDFDDAVSLSRDESGSWNLKVHIADVAHIVSGDGALDLEARRRGTSTYFPGHVIPMLPEILSAHHLSLRPGEDRGVLTVHMKVDGDGRVRTSRLGESLIRSDARLSYEQVQGVMDGKESLGSNIDARIHEMHELSRTVRRRRFERGGFDLQVAETEMTLDGQGVPEELWRAYSDPSHQIIEEFMVLANRAACAFSTRRDLPFIFRVHQEPDTLALEAFLESAVSLRPSLRWKDLEDLPKLRRWLASLPSGEPLTRVLHYLFLRSMKRAVYSPIDIGHFGLGLRGYGHFTSPIRRYADLWNHRIIKWRLRHPRQPVPHEWEDLARAISLSATESEQRSETAEREMRRIKTLRWAERRLGESFAGHVVGCLSQGLFVELDAVPVEGFIPRDEIPFPSRHLDGRLSLSVGRGRGEIRVGDAVVVQIVRVDMRQRWLDLGLLEGPGAVGKLGAATGGSKRRGRRQRKGRRR
jgi:ribonuclease R